ncbi:peptidase M1 [Pseudoalteromonas sp. DL2-H2.2]|uniref:M1 family aminopeptidase n=1 Tax=Pseudoalteromonas sp. DL2-H2.2 TaxID=2908889 RepID=UPI001F47EA54|nr:M1 family aminopeptidase [Pseudoalteromonas sp. DL2-H2.2]MCF2909469.1 peptidase M1 [Pseudoalteromonas sp. DL2-H2.2]
MIVFLIAMLTSIVHAQVSFSQRSLQLAANHYTLNYDINVEKRSLAASGVITVINTSNKNADHIPLRLYRLFRVSSLLDSKGNELEFTQQVLSNEDWPVLQTNYIEIKLDTPLKPNQFFEFQISFDGSLRGYSETGMNYVRDNISQAFSIIRMDALAYPLVTYPNDRVNKRAKFWLNTYEYDVTINVPEGLVVANGGELLSHSTRNKVSTYRYANKLPAWRMDFAVANYQHYSKGNYSVFSWESEQASLQLLEKIAATFDLYTNWFGPLQKDLGYTFIEVPEDYGAQADVTAVIQDAKGFKELDRVYHEISHQWNVKTLDAYSPRWNEGLATFLEELTLDKFGKSGHLRTQTEKNLLHLKKVIKENPLYTRTAFIDYGKHGLNSYITGMVFFHLLYDLVGEKKFNEMIGGFYRTYYSTGATTEQFVQYIKKYANANLEHFFEEWAYSPKYSKRLVYYKSYTQLYEFYKSNNHIEPTAHTD